MLSSKPLNHGDCLLEHHFLTVWKSKWLKMSSVNPIATLNLQRGALSVDFNTVKFVLRHPNMANICHFVRINSPFLYCLLIFLQLPKLHTCWCLWFRGELLVDFKLPIETILEKNFGCKSLSKVIQCVLCLIFMIYTVESPSINSNYIAFSIPNIKIAYKKGYKILLYFEIPTVPEMLTHGLHDHDSKPILYLPLIELNSVATVLSCHILKISCSVDL